jgi:hypothetical protein
MDWRLLLLASRLLCPGRLGGCGCKMSLLGSMLLRLLADLYFLHSISEMKVRMGMNEQT